MKQHDVIARIKKNKETLALLALCAVLLAYVALRASLLSLTWDEVSSFNYLITFTQKPFGDTANNHFLNTLLMYLSYQLFGASELALRLPNVMAFGLYLFAVVKINSLLNLPFRFSALVLLVCNPFVLDFFSLARGYGLGLALMLFSLYLCLRYVRDAHLHIAIVSIVVAGIALLANYTLMNYFIPLVIVLLINTLLYKIITWKKILYSGIILVLAAIIIGLVLPILIELKNNGQFFFGGRNNLYSNTIESLGRCYAYMTSYYSIAKCLFVILFITSIAISALNLFVAINNKQARLAGSLSLVFILSLLSPMLQHFLFKTHYPVERTAIIYYPMMILSLFLWGSFYRKRFARWTHLVFLFLFTVHFFITANLTHTYSWRYESGTKNALLDLQKDSNHKINLGVDFHHLQSVMYYMKVLNVPNVKLMAVSGYEEYPIILEEINRSYYGINRLPLNPKSAAAIVLPEIDYYYLDTFFLDELKKEGISYRIMKSYSYSHSAIIEMI